MHQEGLNRIRDLVDTNLDKLQVGIGITGETAQDTGLETPLTGTYTTTATKTTLQLVEKATVPSTAHGGEVITESVFRDSGNDIDISRQTFTGITKTANLVEIDVETRYFFTSPNN